MWGKAPPTAAKIPMMRITPTHVGKSEIDDDRAKLGEDHPHPCGEKPFLLRYAPQTLGSPPPMWGKVVLSLDGGDK